MATRIRVNDIVRVMTGDDFDEQGKVLMVDHAAGKVIVEGVNRVYKHVRRSQEMPQGGRTQREYPVDTSNVAYFDAESGTGVRLGSEVVDGKKVRVMRPSGKQIDG